MINSKLYNGAAYVAFSYAAYGFMLILLFAYVFLLVVWIIGCFQGTKQSWWDGFHFLAKIAEFVLYYLCRKSWLELKKASFGESVKI